MSSNVTAADYPGTAPGTTILMPDDGDPRSAAWIRALAALVLANDDYLEGEIDDIIAAASVTTTTQTTLNTVNTGGGSLESFNAIGYNASLFAVLDIAAVQVGDVIDASLVFDLQTSAPAGDFLLRLVTVEDYGGANTVTAIPGAAWVTQAGTRIQARLQGIRAITTAGPLRVRLEVSAPTAGVDFLNNFGTGALIVRRTHVGV